MNKRQQGTFSIHSNQFESPDLIANIFSKLNIVPIRAEMMFALWAVEYQALSSAFDKVEPGTIPPYYRIDWKIKNDKITDLQVHKTRELELSGEIRDYEF